VLVILAAIATVLAVLVLIAASRGFGPMFVDPRPGIVAAVVGLIGSAIGLVWIIRIARRDPEAHESFFRSRDLEPRYHVDDPDKEE
jgi:hypothetical protein